MNVCIIGDGLTSLTLAKNLINKKINVHVFQKNEIKNLSLSRTIGISKSNLDFFKKEIYQIPKKDLWEIKKIEIFSEKLGDENLLNFENNKNNLFYMMKNDKLYNVLKKTVSKNKFFKKTIINKSNINEKSPDLRKYDLIINCDSNNLLSKKYFTKRIIKDYYNLAYTAIIKHDKLENNTAIQVFTKFGPIAFLPISNTETSVVCSLENKNKKYSDTEVLNLIKKHNSKLKIKKISSLGNFKLQSSNLRSYHYKNILAFGDLLHRIHPLAGQGFNMTIRDIKILSEIIQNKIDLGMHLDSTIFDSFEKKTRHKNFIFSNSIDFIHEIFNIEKKIKNQGFNKILKLVGKNKNITNYLIRLADKGL